MMQKEYSFFEFADPHAKIGFAYVPNRTDFYLMDPRQNALRMAMYRSIGETNPFLLQEQEQNVSLEKFDELAEAYKANIDSSYLRLTCN